MEPCVARIASSITLLPEVRAVISRAVRIGTPDEISVPSVRVKRAIERLAQHVAEDRHAQQQAVDRCAVRASVAT